VLLEELITPLLIWIGEGWRDGTARIAHEHLMSATIRKFLGEMRPIGAHAPADAPAIVLATPRGQLHETGALMAAILAASEGWRDVYLGPNIPMEEIANAARAVKARAVAISVVYPGDDGALAKDFASLKHYLDKNTALFVGGMGSKAYRGTLDEIGAEWIADLHAFRIRLAALREVDDIRNTPAAG